MLLRGTEFFPSRRQRFLCGACQKLSLLPLSSVLVGVVVMVVFMAFALGFAQPILKPPEGMETVWDFVAAILAFLAIALSASWLATWTCRRTVDRLDPWPRPHRAASKPKRTE
jgi:O-antigen ligase